MDAWVYRCKSNLACIVTKEPASLKELDSLLRSSDLRTFNGQLWIWDVGICTKKLGMPHVVMLFIVGDINSCFKSGQITVTRFWSWGQRHLDLVESLRRGWDEIWIHRSTRKFYSHGFTQKNFYTNAKCGDTVRRCFSFVRCQLQPWTLGRKLSIDISKTLGCGFHFVWSHVRHFMDRHDMHMKQVLDALSAFWCTFEVQTIFYSLPYRKWYCQVLLKYTMLRNIRQCRLYVHIYPPRFLV